VLEKLAVKLEEKAKGQQLPIVVLLILLHLLRKQDFECSKISMDKPASCPFVAAKWTA
jgi:hypothetical protein